MKLINFINPAIDEENAGAYDILVTCSIYGYQYSQTDEMLREHGYYVPENLYNAIGKVLDIDMDLRYLQETEDLC